MNTDFPFSHFMTDTIRDLQFAAKTRDLRLAQKILRSGILDDPQLALCEIAREGDVEGLRVLLEAKCPTSLHASKAAAGEGQAACLRLLIEAGCEISAAPVAAWLERARRTAYFYDYDLEEPTGPIVDAAGGGHVECVQMLIDAGCEIEAEALEIAARDAHTDCLLRLIAADGDSDGGDGDSDGESVYKTITLLDTTTGEIEEIALDIPRKQICSDEEQRISAWIHRRSGWLLGVAEDNWTDNQLDSAFARKWIWPKPLFSCLFSYHSLHERIAKLKAKKAEQERTAVEVCRRLPPDIVRHILCSFF
jgi:hypothetical protein